MLKKYLSFTVLALFVLLSFSCDEVAPVLNPGGNGPNEDVPVEDQMRQVLIEEFTGVRCVNCPAGSEAIEVLLNTYGQQLVAVSIHAGFFAVPYPESDGELENAVGSSLLSLLGEPLGYPTAVVNRKRFDGEENRQIGQSSWPGYIAQELVGDPAVKIDIIPTYNEVTRELALDVDLYVEEDVTADDLRLTVFITESNIKDPQLTPAGTDYEYTHKHALRGAVTAFDGSTLSETFTAGAVVSRSYTTTLPSLWNANECHIVAFVHQGGSTLDVIQAHQVDVVE
jgi:hypothetical protein